jgi:putative endonuclease
LALRGEEAAATMLRGAGFRILQSRYRRRLGEIDLVAEDGEVLVFVEVKTRSGRGFGMPAESVNAVKRRRIARAALKYLQESGEHDRRCRFDVVEVVTGATGALECRHIPDAFRLWPTG